MSKKYDLIHLFKKFKKFNMQAQLQLEDLIKAFIMSDASRHLRAKLKELIERASTTAEINFKKGREVAPLGFAIRENGSRFAFKPIPAGSGVAMFSMFRPRPLLTTKLFATS